MGLFDRRSNCEKLADLLDRERAAVLAGDYAALRRLMADKERLVALAVRDRPAAIDLARLKQKTARNHVLLNAAMDGIRQVSQVLAGSKPARAELSTYDKTGLLQTSQEKSATIERRL